jgi:hypothetical protein
VTIPTSEEISAAHAGVLADGVVANSTIELGILAIRDPVLSEFIQGLMARLRATHVEGASSIAVRSAIVGAVMGGLNLGIRIGEERMKRAAGVRADHPV